MDALIYFDPVGHTAHSAPTHPERPARVEALRQHLDEAGLWQPYPKLAPLVLAEEVLYGIHTPAYLKELEAACGTGVWADVDTYLTPQSWQIALAAAGGAAAVAAAVWDRQAASGFALSRPPGHHALPDRAMGFCLLNNVALAAQYLLHERQAQRIAILDFDLHHGNGTQDIFYERSDVFYISTHQWPLYPGTGALTETGRGAGLDRTANFPFPPGSGDAGFLTVLEEIILPVLERYQPEMLLVSTGFDSHWRDPLGYLQVTAQGYHRLVRTLQNWSRTNCSGRLALILEGGYDLQAIQACGLGVTTALLGLDFTDPLGESGYIETPRWRDMAARAKAQWQV